MYTVKILQRYGIIKVFLTELESERERESELIGVVLEKEI